MEERTRELQVTLEQLAEKSRELEVASKHKSDFLANMSHELRTPLNAIVGFSQVLKQKLFGEVNQKQDEYLDDILSSADHLLSLINDILDLSKVEAGQVELETRLFSLREALERGVVMVRERATKNGVASSSNSTPPSTWCEGDERRIRQVVFNLLSNAVKFTPAGRPGRRLRPAPGRGNAGRGPRHRPGYRPGRPGPHLRGVPAGARRNGERRRAPASASPFPAAWSSCTAAASGSSPSRATAPPSPSPCRWRRAREGAPLPLADLADRQVHRGVRATRGRAGGGNGRLSPPLVLRDEQESILLLQQEKAKSIAALMEVFLRAEAQKLRTLGPGQFYTDDELEDGLGDFLAGSEALSAAYYVGPHRMRAEAAAPLVPAIARCGRRYASSVVRKAQTVGIAVSPLFDCGIFGQNIRLAAGVKFGVYEEQIEAGVIQSLLEETQLNRSGQGYVYAVDSSGKRIADATSVGSSPADPDTAELAQVQVAIHSNLADGSTTGRDFEGHKVLTAYARVDPVGWRVLVERPESAAFARRSAGRSGEPCLSRRLRRLAAIALSILLARRLVRPIKRLQVAAEAIGAGAYDERIELERKDELGALAAAFNQMAERVQELITGLERRVAERTKALEVASKHKSDFLANMSHELRTPLNAIVGFSQVLKQKLFGEVNQKQDEYLDDILSSADHLLALINDILDLSKVEAGQVELERRAVLAARGTRAGGGDGPGSGRARRRRDRLAPRPDRVDLVDGDERRIRQVVFNLLSNAVKFTPAGDSVGVATARADGEVLVVGHRHRPRDRARGPGPDLRGVPASRVGGNGERPEGTGLGPRTLQEPGRAARRAHLGRLASSGKGSTFTFTLPVGSPSMSGRARPRGRGQREEHEALPRRPPGEGLRAARGGPGEEAVELATEHVPDLILMDVQLPGMDGIEALGRIRADERTSSIPVVALTAQAMAGDRERFLEAGFDGYISKPVDVLEFIETVGRYCEAGDG